MNEQLLDALRHAREAKEKVSATRKEMVEVITRSDEYTSLQAAEMIAEGEIERLTEQINQEVLTDYELDHNKHPHPKIEVKTFKTFRLVFPDSARQWCFTHLPAALDLNVKKFEKYCRVFGGTEDVVIGEEIKVQIAREL